MERIHEHEEAPTRPNLDSARWVIAIDKGQRLIESAIARLEAGGDVEAVLADLREAHRLVDGRQP